MNPCISVIVPVYNSEHTVERCVLSVLRQTYTNLDIILVDDGSADRSGMLCDKLQKADYRVHVIHQSNQGVSAARNAGIDAAAGEYVFFLDGDDELSENALKGYVHILNQYCPDAVIGSLILIDGGSERKIGFTEEKKYYTDIWENICMNPKPYGWAGGKMFKRKVIDDTRFNVNMVSQEDLSFNLDVYKKCASVVCSSFAGYRYYYTAPKRFPQTIDYIQNQLKILYYGASITELTDRARKQVMERIATIVYTALYSTESGKDFYSLAGEIRKLNKLEVCKNDFRRYRTRHSLFVSMILSKRLFPGYLYVRIRKTAARGKVGIRRLLRYLRSH